MLQLILNSFRLHNRVTSYVPWPVVFVRAEPVSAAHPGMLAVYACSCHVPPPAYVGVRCSAGQGIWMRSHQNQDCLLSVTAPAVI